MKRIFRGNMYFLIVLILEIFSPYILFPIYKAIGIKDIRIILFLNHMINFIIPAIIYVIVTKCNVKETFRLNKIPFKELILVIVLGFVCIPIMNFFGLLSSMFFENNVGNLMTSIVGTPYIVLLLLIAVMPAITEEITLRGIVLSGYDGKSKFKSALIVGLFFGIFHLDAQQFLYATVLGFILAYVVRATGSIYSSMIMHFVLNGSSITIQKLSILQDPTVLEQASDVSIKTLTFSEKFVLLQAGLAMMIFAGVIAFIIIQKLNNLGKARGVRQIPRGLCKLDGEVVPSKERIIDIPFIVIVSIYIITMLLRI
ncbi:CPBP family intramembrane glutamic endopeptidase [Clostridium sp.]|uniref:CPBP family intramembrane glutamic endopeptidase n=1 Tax=Clostridium sp. TaxID=1506 RepID=UPI002FC5DD3E